MTFYGNDRRLPGLLQIMLDKPIPAHVVHCRSLTLVEYKDMKRLEEIRERLVSLIKLANPVTLTYFGNTFFSECLSTISEMGNLTELKLFSNLCEENEYHIEESCANKLTVLHVDGGNRGNLASIAGFTSLNELHLENMTLSEDEFQKIASLPLLKSLRVRGVYNNVRDQNKADLGCLCFTLLLSRLVVKLVELELSDIFEVNDDTMRYLKAQGQLKKLVVTHTVITDAGLAHISNLSELIELDVSYNSITDSGLKHLSKLIKLKNLNISHNVEITDAGVKYLVHLTNLDELNLSGTNIEHESSFYQPGDPPVRLLPTTAVFNQKDNEWLTAKESH